METNKEIAALLNLIDDPDEEVYDLVSEKIMGFGKPIIPNLENLWETIHNEQIQERIELIIHRLHFGDLLKDFRDWSVSEDDPDLLQGALLISKFEYPDLDTAPILQEVEKIKRTIWLELNSYLTPLEEVSILSSILFNYYSIKAGKTNHRNPNEFLVHKLIESKKGNQYSNGVLYLLLCEMLDVPVRVMNVPNQLVLAYYRNSDIDEHTSHPQTKIEFFIDPTTGLVFTQKDLENYFNRISLKTDPSFYIPKNNVAVIQQLLKELGKCFTDEKNSYKQIELNKLADSLNR